MKKIFSVFSLGFMFMLVVAVSMGAPTRALATAPVQPEGDEGIKIDICHENGQSGNWNVLNVNENGWSGHGGHDKDFKYEGGNIEDKEGWCKDHHGNNGDDENNNDDNDDEDCDDNDDCVPQIDTATIHATKIVCDAESYLPNWGDHAPVTAITSTTAATFLATGTNAQHCSIQPWTFEWALSNVSGGNPGNNVATGGAGWSSFAGGTVNIPLPVSDSFVWMREQVNPDYIPFSGDILTDTDDVSAEMYCNIDVLHYDNYDRVDNLISGEDYYCIAFNVEKEKPLTCEAKVNLLTNGSFEATPVTNGALWDIFPSGTPNLGWLASWINPSGAPAIANLELQKAGLNSWTASEGSQWTELDSDWDGPSGSSNGEAGAVAISQTINTISGEQYTVSFDFSARPNTSAAENKVEVLVDGNVVYTAGPTAGAGNTVWSTHSVNFIADGSTSIISLRDAGTGNNSQGTFVDDVSLMCNPEPEEPPVVNACPLPSAGVGDNADITAETVNNAPEGENNLQLSLNAYGVNATTDQTQTQLWNVTPNSTVTINSKYVSKFSGHVSVFGYYTNSNMTNFVPVFKTANVTGYGSVPMYTDNAGMFTVNVGSATTIGFAIKTFNNDVNMGNFATENALNTNSSDQVVVYNPSLNKYVLGFEDLINGDSDFNDLVVEVTMSCDLVPHVCPEGTYGIPPSCYPIIVDCPTGQHAVDNQCVMNPQCSDAVDNVDGEDTLIDANDPGCMSGPQGAYNPADDDEGNVTKNDLPECSDATNNDGDDWTDAEDPGCHTDGNSNNKTYNPLDDNETNEPSGDGNGNSSGSLPFLQRVLGAETSVCNWDIKTYMRKGHRNDREQVKVLQRDLLNGYMHLNIPVDGVYGPITEDAVKAFQIAKKDKILIPWNLNLPTGIFYKTTLVEAKNSICPERILPIPTDLTNWSENSSLVPTL